MKVALLSDCFLPRLGGIEVQVHGLATRLAAAGQPTEPAMTWAYGVVGMVQLTVHWWTAARTVSSAELIEQLTALAHTGLGTLLPAQPARSERRRP